MTKVWQDANLLTSFNELVPEKYWQFGSDNKTCVNDRKALQFNSIDDYNVANGD